MNSAFIRILLRAVVALAVAAAALALAPTQAAHAETGIGTVAQELREDPVYVDPRMADELSRSDAEALADRIEGADKPVFVAVLPETAEFAPDTLLQDLRTQVGITGVYAVQLGDRFAAGADPAVMSRDAVSNLTGSVRRSDPGDASDQLSGFVDQAVRQADGQAPQSWDEGSGDGAGIGAGVTLAALLAAGGGGALLLHRRNARRRDADDRAALDKLRTVVDEDITAFGEELDRLSFNPSAPEADDAMRQDFTHALDAYDKAKVLMDGARRPDDVRAVTEALEDGRFALATLEARRSGKPLPERRAPCFFDPRHGPSVADAEWAPVGGAPRTVPVCAADAARLADGAEPMARTVDTEYGRRPYWEAGPVYGPWAGGYFGGGLLPGLLMGTMLGSTLGSPYAYGWHGGDMGGYEGGDYSGGDFNPDDFSGFGGGDFGGGDFGGGGFDGGF